MLTITVPGQDLFVEDTQEFITSEEFELELEHSLVALSKWESFYEKPFLTKDEKTAEEILGYINAMILTKNPPRDIIRRLSQENLDDIHAYIQRKMTATWFSEQKSRPSRQVITSELIYYWMVSFNIPMECENWHLQRLFTLIQVISVQNSGKSKKTPAKDLAAQRRALNEQRLAQSGSTG